MPNNMHEPTDRQRAEAEAYAAVGVPHHDIAALLGMSTHTLLKHYKTELTIGKAKANAKVGKSLFQQATEGNTSAAIFWMKAQAGWREKQEIEQVVTVAIRGPDADSLATRLERAAAGRSSG